MRRIIALLALAAGCAGPATQLRRERARQADEIDALRAELRREKRRARELETENLVLRDRIETAQVGAGRVGVPRLPVEVLGPDEPTAASLREYGDDAEIVATTDDGVEIVYVGDAATGRSIAAPEDLELADADDLEYAPDDETVVVDRPAPRKKAAPRPAAKKADPAAAAYQAAVGKVNAGDHAGALTALRGFLDAHPRHDLADNAQYWLGEVYYDQKDWARAIVEFRATVEAYPRGNKVPDALLKMGFSFAALGQTAKARAALEQVIETYPRTQPAELAARKLAELR